MTRACGKCACVGTNTAGPPKHAPSCPRGCSICGSTAAWQVAGASGPVSRCEDHGGLVAAMIEASRERLAFATAGA